MQKNWIKIIDFFTCGFQEKRMTLFALFLLLWATVALKFMPFEKLKTRFGTPQKASPEEGLESEKTKILAISSALNRARGLAFWRPNCYPQAIAAKMILAKHGLAGTLYLGVWKSENQFKAHAWVRSHNVILTGGGVASDYTILAYFS